MTMKPTLLVLAAGLGSRYGSLKQMDGIGPCGEAIIDYTVYDAIEAGFGKVVFVIRDSFYDEFTSFFNKERFGNAIEVEYVLQEVDKLPTGYSVPEGRTKPWGTAHAILMAQDIIAEPFAVVNADDFYGRDGLQAMAQQLMRMSLGDNEWTMVAYELSNTLSENGTVSRGVCTVDENGMLCSMVERTKIEKQGDKIVYLEEDMTTPLADNTPVSMNLFGFTPDFFTHSEAMFKEFLDTSLKVNPNAEFYIPYVVSNLIASGEVQVRVVRTASEWFGVTYLEDRPDTMHRVSVLTSQGIYPSPLWKA